MLKENAKRKLNPLKSPIWGIGASIVFVAVTLAVLVYFDIHKQLLDLLLWVEQQGVWAAVLFILLMAMVVVLLLPGIFFTTGAGFVFGVVEGTLYVVIGSTIGAAMAFLLARYCFGKQASAYILARSKLHMVSREMSRHDFKVVLLTRLVPFFPSKLSNYFFGLTDFSFQRYVLGTLIGFIPFSLHNVYLGSITADIATLGQTAAGRTPVQWMFYLIGFAATVVALIYFNNLARRALSGYLE